MREAKVRVNGVLAGTLRALPDDHYQFTYYLDYQGAPVSLTMPIKQATYEFKKFPPFFEGLLPEGAMLEALLKKFKLDKNDYFGQLLTIGQDVVGAVSIEE